MFDHVPVFFRQHVFPPQGCLLLILYRWLFMEYLRAASGGRALPPVQTMVWTEPARLTGPGDSALINGVGYQSWRDCPSCRS